MVAAVTTVIIGQRLEELDPFIAAWDRLAIAERQPLSRPGWLLSWWRARCQEGHLRGGELRVVMVFDDQGLAGVAPLFVEDVRAKVVHLRFLGQGAFPDVHPLVRGSGADGTIDVLTGAVACLRPRPSIISFDAIDVESSWPQTLVQRWPGRGAWLRVRPKARATAVRLAGTFEEWVQSRRSDWRGGYRRRQRRFFERGGVVRRAESAEDVRRGVNEFVRLHHARWTNPSDRLSAVVARTLREAGELLVADAGFRLWTVEIDGDVIGATVFAAAGGAVTALLTAYDPQWGPFAPGQRSMVAGIEEGFRRGDDVVDLSFGEYRYKFQLANEVRWISWYEVFPRDHRYPLARAYAFPRHTREGFNHARVRLRARSRLVEARRRVVAARVRSAHP
jgi:CelD/BcsL family acetyltransferase involved in cellulose biosynthesis